MGIKNGVRAPESLEAIVLSEVSQGLSNRDVANHHDMSESCVRHILKRYGTNQSNIVRQLTTASGNVALRFGMLVFDKLTQRFQKESDTWNPAQMAVMGGIGLQRGMELLGRTQEVEAPNWSSLELKDLGIDSNVQTAIQADTVKAE